ncbi:MAG: hypothetical protein JXQ99_26425 [Hyphomicrobiaceae bacterium]
MNNSEWDKAHLVISNWKNNQEASFPCPRCDTPGLTLEDHSARPYSEWYALNCGKCNLEVTMHLPLAPTPGAPV